MNSRYADLRVLATAITIGISGLATATPIRWNMEPTTFGDGAIGSGWFVYDAATREISDANIQVTGGDQRFFFDTTFGSSFSDGSINGNLKFNGGSNGAVFQRLAIASSELPDLFGTVSNVTLTETWQAVGAPLNGSRTATSLLISVPSQVPEPPPAFLVFVALVCLAPFLRHRKQFGALGQSGLLKPLPTAA